MTVKQPLYYLIKTFPFISFIIVWSVVFLFYYLGYFNIHTISQSTVILVLITLLTYILTFLAFILFDNNFLTRNKDIKVIEINENKALKVIFLLCTASLMGSILKSSEIASYFNGYDIYFSNPLVIRSAVTKLSDHPGLDTLIYKGGSYLINFGVVSSFYAGIYFVKAQNSKYILLLPIFTVTISSLVTFSRFTFITGIMFLLLSIIFTSCFITDEEKIYIKKKLFYSIAVIVSLILIMVAAIFAVRTFYSEEITELLFKSLYFYITGGIVALDNILKEPSNLTYGASSFRTIVRWLDVMGLWPFYEFFSTHNPFTKVSPNYRINTYTFIRSLYQDFGFYGLVFTISIWAYLSKLSMKLLFSKYSIYTLYFSIIITFSLIMSFFSFYFQGIALIIFWLLSIVIVEKTVANNVISIIK